MGRDVGFWTWPVDGAVSQSHSDRLVIGSAALYAIGALLLLARALFVLPGDLTIIGAGLLLAGVAGSVLVLARVLMARSRTAAH